MINRLYKLIWLVLQILASVYETLHFLQLRLQAFIYWSYDLRLSRATITHRDRALLLKCKDELTKIPQHLNLIIGPDPLANINESVVEKVLSYAFIMGIECVSVFDVRNESMGKIQIEKMCAKRKSNWKELAPNQYEWRPADNVISPKSFSKNMIHSNGSLGNGAHSVNGGITNANTCHNQMHEHLKVFELNDQDNRPLLTKICRELFEQRNTSNVNKLLGDRKLLEQHITDKLAKHMQWEKIVDPELSIIFNTFTCTYGVLPWQTRFTEFHTFETGRYINAENFVKVLYKYSKCEQRWGK